MEHLYHSSAVSCKAYYSFCTRRGFVPDNEPYPLGQGLRSDLQSWLDRATDLQAALLDSSVQTLGFPRQPGCFRVGALEPSLCAGSWAVDPRICHPRCFRTRAAQPSGVPGLHFRDQEHDMKFEVLCVDLQIAKEQIALLYPPMMGRPSALGDWDIQEKAL